MNDDAYFDPIQGRYITPETDGVTSTYASLKVITAALANAEKLSVLVPDDIHDAVDHLLYYYINLVRHGIREDFGHLHGGVSWSLMPDDFMHRALISYQEGPGEWAVDCFSDEVPLWLLVGLLRRVARRKPLGDQNSDDVIKAVDAMDAAYKQSENFDDAAQNIRLSGQFRRDDDE